MTEVKRVDKVTAMRYLMPALRILLNLNIGYEVKGYEVVIKIPKYLPIKNKTK